MRILADLPSYPARGLQLLNFMYLNLHFTISEKKGVKEYMKKFNAEVKKQYPGVSTIMMKNGKIKRQYEYHKYTLKSTHQTTMLHIHRAYYAHLNKLQASGQPIDTPFDLNNQALANMRGSERTTIFRHINYRLQNIYEVTGHKILKSWVPIIISKKKSGRYFELTLNHKYLFAEQNPTVTKLVAEHRPDIIEAATKANTDTPFLNPSFDIIFPLYVAFCNTIEKQDTSNNNNIEIGICLKGDFVKIAQETFLQETQKLQSPYKNLPASARKNVPAAEFKIPAEKDLYGEKIERHIKKAFWYYITFLYQGISISEDKISEINKYLYRFFSGSRSFWTRAAYFIKLCNIQIETNKRIVSWIPPEPWKWINPETKASIKATENWYITRVLPQENKNAEWNSHRKLFDEIIAWYLKNKGVPGAYKKCCEKIGRKGKGKFIDEFNNVVLHEKKYEKQLFIDLKHKFLNESQ